MNKSDKVKSLAWYALGEIDKEIAKRYQSGDNRIPTIYQLVLCKERVEEMISSLESGDKKNNDKSGMGRMIMDSWPFQNSLGEILVSLESNYNQL